MRGPAVGAALGVAPLLALVLLVGLVPFGTALYDSFFHDVYGERSPAGLDNYRAILGDRGFLMSLGITVAWACAHTLLSLALASPVAARISRAGRWSALLYGALLVPWAMPASMGAALWRALVHGGWGTSLASAVLRVRLDLLSSPLWALAATMTASVWTSLPLTVFLVLAAMASSPASLRDAARVDGATETQVDLWVRVPSALPAIFAAGILDFLRAFREITVILVMTRGGPPLRGGVTEGGIVGATTTVEVYLYELFSRSRDTGLAAAAALLVATLVAAVLAASLMAQRRRAQPRRARARRRGPDWGRWLPGGRVLWAPWSWAARLFVTVCSALLIFTLLRLSFSGLGAVFFDSLLPRFPTAGAYRTVLVDSGLAAALFNTLLLALPTAGLLTALAFPASAALWGWSGSARGLPGPRATAGLIVGTQLLGLVTGMHAMVPLYVLFRRLGLIGSYLPVVLVYTAHGVPFALLALRAALGSMPASFVDAARAEGMSGRAYTARVLLPLAVPTLIVIGGVGFLDAWNGFLVPLVFLTDDLRYPVTLKLFSLVGSIGSANPRWNLFAAGSVMNLLVVGALALAVRRPLGRSALAEHAE